MDSDAQQELSELRASIDNIDAALVHLLAERFKNTKRVGRLKARAMMPPSDPEREAAQIARLRELAADADLDPSFAEKLNCDTWESPICEAVFQRGEAKRH